VKKNRPRKPRRQPPPKKQALPPQFPRKPGRLWWRLLLQPKALLIEIPGAILVFVGFVSLWNMAVPTVLPPSVSNDENPLVAPFVIENRGSVLALNQVSASCNIDKTEWSAGSGITVRPEYADRPKGTIHIGQSALVDCAIATRMPNWPRADANNRLVSARAQILVNYSTFFIPRTFLSTHYCWTPIPPAGHAWLVCDQL
jgi:hypothetical protein